MLEGILLSLSSTFINTKNLLFKKNDNNSNVEEYFK
jgi:hypothetical protein